MRRPRHATAGTLESSHLIKPARRQHAEFLGVEGPHDPSAASQCEEHQQSDRDGNPANEAPRHGLMLPQAGRKRRHFPSSGYDTSLIAHFYFRGIINVL